MSAALPSNACDLLDDELKWPDMRDLDIRLDTFYDPPWPYLEQKIRYKYCTPNALAEEGFYYSPTEDNPDCVVCYCCGCRLHSWVYTDIPSVEHNKHSPNCKLIKIKQNNSLNKLAKEKLKQVKSKHDAADANNPII